MVAHIISVGTELLLGEVVNTNATFIANELKNIGISVYHINTLGDNEQRLLDELYSAYKESDIIITTGGLGPTKDDLTKEVVAKSLGLDMILYEDEVEKIKRYFKDREHELNEGNMTQAYFPNTSEIINNPNGTASGCIINKNNKIIIVLPGPPREIKPMIKQTVIPYLEKLSSRYFAYKTINVIGVGESKMEEMVMPLIDSQSNPTIAPYFKESGLTLRVMASSDDKNKSEKMLTPMIEKVHQMLGENMYAIGDEISIEDCVCRYLIEKNMSISTAESCTGGMLGSRIINVSGASRCYKQGYITYSNDSKMKLLGVKEETLQKYGAVSEQTAIEMAIGCAKNSNSDIAISTTGVAGPDGGTDEKPVGLVYVGLYIKGNTYVKKFNIFGTRQRIRRITTSHALDFLRRTINIPVYEF